MSFFGKGPEQAEAERAQNTKFLLDLDALQQQYTTFLTEDAVIQDEKIIVPSIGAVITRAELQDLHSSIFHRRLGLVNLGVVPSEEAIDLHINLAKTDPVILRDATKAAAELFVTGKTMASSVGTSPIMDDMLISLYQLKRTELEPSIGDLFANRPDLSSQEIGAMIAHQIGIEPDDDVRKQIVKSRALNDPLTNFLNTLFG